MSTARDAQGHFLPGAGSANPGGRPKEIAAVKDLARKAAPDAICALVKIVREGKSDAAIVAAATALLDRAYGRPTQHIAGAEDEPPIAMTFEERAAAQAERRAAAIEEIERAFTEREEAENGTIRD